MRFDVDECETECGLRSDHSLVKLCFKLDDLQPRGRGFFKFNGDKTLGGVRLREKKYHFHLGHYNNNSFVGKPKDLAVHV